MQTNYAETWAEEICKLGKNQSGMRQKVFPVLAPSAFTLMFRFKVDKTIEVMSFNLRSIKHQEPVRVKQNYFKC